MKRFILLSLALLTFAVSASPSFAAFGAGVPTQAKADFLAGIHDDADSYKCALYTQAAATGLNATSTVYTTSGEIINGTAGTAGYTAGGVAVTRSATIVNGTKGVASFGNCVFNTLTTPSGGVDAFIIYNTTDSNKIVYIGSITATSSTAGTLTITMPTQDATSGLIRLP